MSAATAQSPSQGPSRGLSRRVIALPLLAVLVALARLAYGADADCSLRIGWTPYALYTYLDPSGEAAGIDVDIITAAATQAGCRTTFRQLPWARILLELRGGTIDATSSASRTPERDIFALFSIAYRPAEKAVFVRRGETAFYPARTLANLPSSTFTLGYVIGYHYGPAFDAMLNDSRLAGFLDGSTDYEINLRKLLVGRVHGVLADDVGVMVGEAKRLGVAGQIERLPLPIASDDLHFMFSRASVDPRIVAAVDEALRAMQADGRLDAIFRKYLN